MRESRSPFHTVTVPWMWTWLPPARCRPPAQLCPDSAGRLPGLSQEAFLDNMAISRLLKDADPEKEKLCREKEHLKKPFCVRSKHRPIQLDF